MRHIPEEELHAYLDQALSRAQAVEIESHLAHCAACREARDGIARLRDRTTALLSTLGPGRTVVAPPFAELRRRHLTRSARRASLVRGMVWAASLVGAVGLGYAAHSWRDATATPPAAAPALAATPTPAPTPAATLPVTTVATRAPEAPRRATSAAAPGRASSATELAAQEHLAAPAGVPASGLWRNETFERAVEAGLTVPRVAGLPVLQIQVQEASPSSVVAVDQQLGSGEVVRTVEGPAQQVSALDRSAVASLTPGAAPTPSSASVRNGNRMLLMTGRVPAESLRALLARVKTH
jgi:hypothetical protein